MNFVCEQRIIKLKWSDLKLINPSSCTCVLALIYIDQLESMFLSRYWSICAKKRWHMLYLSSPTC